jgi:hypothetical protein
MRVQLYRRASVRVCHVCVCVCVCWTMIDRRCTTTQQINENHYAQFVIKQRNLARWRQVVIWL